MFRLCENLRKFCLRLVACCALCISAASFAFACEPCLAERSLNLQQSIAAADVIVVGYRIALTKSPETTGDEPAQIEIQTERVLRGNIESNVIRVRSYSGMCPYGVVLPEKQHFVLLLKPSGDGKTYVAVDRCSVKALPVTDDKAQFVTIDEEKHQTVSLDRFLLDSVAPPQYKPIIEMLQYLKNSGDEDTSSGFDAARGGRWQVDRVMSFVSKNGVTISDVNTRGTHRYTSTELRRALANKRNAAAIKFIHLGFIYANAYQQYSTLNYSRGKGNAVVVNMSGWYRLTFTTEQGALKLTKLEYLMVEGD